MPNHYTNTIVVVGHWSGDKSTLAQLQGEAKAPSWAHTSALDRVLPMPDELVGTRSPGRVDPDLQERFGASNWYDWAIANWGTKWGLYDRSIQKLEGDCGAVLLTFVTAWGPPHEAARMAIIRELREVYNITDLKWIGCDPFDDSVEVLASYSDKDGEE